MTRFRLSRHWALLLMLYVAIDFMNPTLPGVFYFDSGTLFVDGVVQAKSTTSGPLETIQPMGVGDQRIDDDKTAAVPTSQPPRVWHRPWSNLKRNDSALFSSSSSAPDSSPTEPLS